MKKNNIKKSLMIALTFITLFSANAFASDDYIFIGKPPSQGSEKAEAPGGNADNKGGGGSKTKPDKGNSSSSQTNKPGSSQNPYIRKISVPSYLQYNTHILPSFNSLAAGEGNKKVTAWDFTKANGSSHVSKVVDNNGNETYVKWLYPVVTVTRNTTNKIKEVSRKNDYFNWVATGPESWTKKTDSNRLTHTFTKVGKYKIVYTPHQLITTSHQNFTNTKATAYYPTNGSSTTLLNKDTAGKLTTKTEGVWRTDYRQIWEFEITAADVGRPIPIGPDTPPQNIVIDPNDPKLLESETQLIH